MSGENITIGNYHILSNIASGSFGRVYLAQHRVLTTRIVALKLMHAVPLSSKQESEQFLHEAKILELLHHPYILPILDVGIHEGIPYIVSEYAAGNSLRMRLNKGRCSLQESLTILSQMGQALDYAHQQNIIHRDVKPENILFNARGDALLADFGLAIMLATASVKYVSYAGTPRYMAPEQCRGVVSKESDQYALGCIAYELFTGRPPFSSPDPMALMYQHVNDAPTPLSTYTTHLPLHIEQAVLKALMKQRQERHSSVTAFLAALLPPDIAQPTTIQFSTLPTQIQLSEKTAIAPTRTPEPAIADNTFPQASSSARSLPPLLPPVAILQSNEMSFNVKKTELFNDKETLPDFSGQEYKATSSARKRRGPAYRRLLVAITCVLILVILAGSLFWIFQLPHSAKTISGVSQPTLSATSLLSPTAGVLTGTPTPTAILSSTPTTSVSATPTLASNYQPILTVNRASENANTDCSYDANNGWVCPVALHNSQSTQRNLMWTASSQSANVVSFSQTNGTLSPGQTVTIKVFVSNVSCPTTFILSFSGSDNKVTVPWHCAAPTLTASPPDLSYELNSCPVSNNAFHCSVYLNVGTGSEGGLNWSSSGSEYICDVNGCRTGPLSSNAVTPSRGFIVSSANYVQVSVTVSVCQHMAIKDTIIFSGPANSATVTYSCNSSM